MACSSILGIFLVALMIIRSASTHAIQSSDGEVVTCVDKKQQPAFENQLLKNHIFQERPSEMPRVSGTTPKSKRLTYEAQVSTAKCPEGTVPIRSDDRTANRTKPSTGTNYTPGHEYAIMYTKTPPKLYGTRATINVWDPAIEKGANEMSISQIWISSGRYEDGNLNTIEVGWQVLPKIYKDNKPRLFLFWTSNAYRTGCYNVRCAGFIQTSSSIVIGGAISPISSFGGSQFEITIHVWKDQNSGNWWLSLGRSNLLVGYWPAEIFTTLADHATIINWGGEVLNLQTFGRHTTTQMGSGHFPSEGFGKSSYFRDLEIVDNNNSLQPVQNPKRILTNPKYYDVKGLYTEEWKTHFFYGGPGFRHLDSGAVPSALSPWFLYFFLSFVALV